MRKQTLIGGLVAFAAYSAAFGQVEAPNPVPGLDQVKHIIVIYLENRSFDSLYGHFPGADGLQDAGPTSVQVDRDGKPYDTLPPVLDTTFSPPQVDARFPPNQPNGPFAADAYAPLAQTTGDAVHRFYQEQLQIDGGKMDKYVAWTDAGGLVMATWDSSREPLWRYASKYVLLDHFHHATFGGSFLNHIFMICACAPSYSDAPSSLIAKIGDHGQLVSDGAVTPEGYAVNTLLPRGGPLPPGYPLAKTLPPQTQTTIGDRLDEKGIDWAWYSGGWNDAVANHADPQFQYHHQPFAFFAHYSLGTPGANAHLKDETDFVAAITKGELPPVAFFKPIGEENEHPGYASVAAGEAHTAMLLGLIEKSPLWKDSVIIVTYDENGGMWDHVAPPAIDQWGPGTRVPTIIISPFAKPGFIDHTTYDTMAIARLIETRYGLKPLGTRDASSGDLTSALNLN